MTIKQDIKRVISENKDITRDNIEIHPKILEVFAAHNTTLEEWRALPENRANIESFDSIVKNAYRMKLLEIAESIGRDYSNRFTKNQTIKK